MSVTVLINKLRFFKGHPTLTFTNLYLNAEDHHLIDEIVELADLYLVDRDGRPDQVNMHRVTEAGFPITVKEIAGERLIVGQISVRGHRILFG